MVASEENAGRQDYRFSGVLPQFLSTPRLFVLRHFASRARPYDIATITSTIERALASAGLRTDSGPMHGVTETIRRTLSSAGMSQAVPARGDESIVEVAAREVDAREADLVLTDRSAVSEPASPGQFLTRQFRNQAGTRAYKIYVPTSRPSAPMPLIVMLHGCTRSPDDFAAGTQMNRLAEQHGFIVVYPEQAPNANGSKCWTGSRRRTKCATAASHR